MLEKFPTLIQLSQTVQNQISSGNFLDAEKTLDALFDIKSVTYGPLIDATKGYYVTDSSVIYAVSELSGMLYTELGDSYLRVFDLTMRNGNESKAAASISNANRCYQKAFGWVSARQADLAVRICYGFARIAFIENNIAEGMRQFQIAQTLQPTTPQGIRLQRTMREMLEKIKSSQANKRIFKAIDIASELTDKFLTFAELTTWLKDVLAK